MNSPIQNSPSRLARPSNRASLIQHGGSPMIFHPSKPQQQQQQLSQVPQPKITSSITSPNSYQNQSIKTFYPPQSPAKQQNQSNLDESNSYTRQNLPNANTSGLPVAKVRPFGSNGQTSSSISRPSLAQPTQSKLTVPSTIGSAIRRRPVAPVSTQPHQIGSNSPTLGPRSESSASFQRRNQQYLLRPGSQAGSSTNLIKAQFRPTRSSSIAIGTQKLKHTLIGQNGTTDDELNCSDSTTKEIKSLPPLKSTSYLNRLTTNMPSSPNTVCHKPTTTLPTTSRSSMLPQPGSLVTRQQATVRRSSSSVKDDECNSQASYHSGYSSVSLKLVNNMAQSNRDGNELDDYEPTDQSMTNDDDDNDASGDEDDDATTATTLTQTSESNDLNLENANRELNNMIKMLSSSAILGESEKSFTDGEKNSPNTDNQLVQRRIVGRENDSKIKRLPKSQSQGFGIQPKSGSRANTSSLPKPQLTRLARPKSRIIFDPTNNQFHVSCSEQDGYDAPCHDDYSESYSDSTTTSSSLLEQKKIDASKYSSSTINNDNDETSSKLIDAQNRIKTLTSLPTCLAHEGLDDKTAMGGDPMARPLRDCRGSLESFMAKNDRNDALPPRSNDSVLLNSSQHPRALRGSSFGSAIRSFFKIQPNQNQSPDIQGSEQSVNNSRSLDSPVDSVVVHRKPTKVATIIRHSSLRTDPRPIEDRLSVSYSGRKISPSSDRHCSPNELGTMGMGLSRTATNHNLGGDLLHRATKRLSASSSSLTSKFKHIMTSSGNQTNAGNYKTNDDQQWRDDCTNRPISVQSSFNQKSTIKKDIGLPPRTPVVAPSESIKQHADTSSGNSSDGSFQTTSMNDTAQQVEQQTENDKLSLSGESCNGYGNLNGTDNDADTTILSETSTIQGDSGTMMYVNKCAELERTVTSLKNMLIAKERELTDLQLSQLHNDYTIDRLKSQVSKLEKENGQLKSMLKSNHQSNAIAQRAKC